MSKYFLIFLLLFSSAAFALTVDEPLSSPEQEARAKSLFTELRCVVCQGEAIADSPADVARDMRRAVRELVAKGKNDQEVVDYFVAQYGDKVRMMPSFNAGNFLLWFGPLLVLFAGVFIAWRTVFKGSSHD